MEENIRYLIGIDFGHGETTASYIDLEDTVDPRSLHIHGGQYPEQDYIESWICKDEDDNWIFVRGIEDYSSPDLRIGFKQSMDVITPENKEAFGAFVRLVFERILELQPFLHYNPQTGERNFKLCVACSSGWNDSTNNQIHEYLNFMQQFIPASWVIKENDAVYFKFKNMDFADKSVLVIDIGSSTIDFTYYDRQTGRAKDFIVYPHGASCVERLILEYLINNDETFQEGQKRITEALATTGIGNRNWMMSVRHFIKAQKEDFYTNERSIMMLSAPIRAFYSTIPSGTLLDVDFEKAELEGNVIKEYVDQLRTDFETVSNKISPQIVIITGGASRMPWVCHMVRDVFCQKNPNVNVYRDPDPSHVVSQGIVAYALARTTFEREFDAWVKKFWEEYTTEHLAQLVHEYFNEVVRDIQMPMIKKFMDPWIEGEIVDKTGKCTLDALLPHLYDYYDRIFGPNNDQIKRNVNELLQNKLEEHFKWQIYRYFGNANTINVPLELDINVSFGGNMTNYSRIEEWSIEICNKVYCHDFLDFEILLDKIEKAEKEKAKRRQFAHMMLDKLSTDTNRLDQTELDSAVQKIKEKLSQCFYSIKSRYV